MGRRWRRREDYLPQPIRQSVGRYLAWIRHFVGDPRVRNENCEFWIELLLPYYLEPHLVISY